jgi:hypothetical protein
MTSVVTGFTHKATTLLASDLLCFSLLYLYYLTVDLHHQHRPTADVFHLISTPTGLPGPS